MLTIDLAGYRDVEGTLWLLSYFPSDVGLSDGQFDEDAWVAASAHISAVPGADVRVAFREAYRIARIAAREHGGMEFLPTTFDDEPCLFPDRIRNGALVPGLFMIRPTIHSAATLPGRQIVTGGRGRP